MSWFTSLKCFFGIHFYGEKVVRSGATPHPWFMAYERCSHCHLIRTTFFDGANNSYHVMKLPKPKTINETPMDPEDPEKPRLRLVK